MAHIDNGWKLNPSHILNALAVLLLGWVASTVAGMHDDLISMKKDVAAAIAMKTDVAELKTKQDDHEKRIYRLEYAILPESSRVEKPR